MNWLQRIAQGFYGDQKGYWLALWVDPEGKIYDIDSTHHGWIYENMELLVDEYDIDLAAWTEQRYEEEIGPALEEERNRMIADIAWENSIEESQVTLSQEQEESLNDSASTTADEAAQLSGVDLVDMLITKGWLRVGKRTVIHIEGNEDLPRFFDRAEMVLIERFSDVWKNRQYKIVINNWEIYSGDLQDAGSLESAIRKSDSRTNYYMHNR